jgi:hypothetical protein
MAARPRSKIREASDPAGLRGDRQQRPAGILLRHQRGRRRAGLRGPVRRGVAQPRRQRRGRGRPDRQRAQQQHRHRLLQRRVRQLRVGSGRVLPPVLPVRVQRRRRSRRVRRPRGRSSPAGRSRPRGSAPKSSSAPATATSRSTRPAGTRPATPGCGATTRSRPSRAARSGGRSGSRGRRSTCS